MTIKLTRSLFLLLIAICCPSFLSAQNSIVYSINNSIPPQPSLFVVNVTGNSSSACPGFPTQTSSNAGIEYDSGSPPLSAIPTSVNQGAFLTVTNGKSGVQGGSSWTFHQGSGTPGSDPYYVLNEVFTYSVSGHIITSSDNLTYVGTTSGITETRKTDKAWTYDITTGVEVFTYSDDDAKSGTTIAPLTPPGCVINYTRNAGPATATVQWSIYGIQTPCSLSITTSSLPNGTANSAYPSQTLVATGGTPPLTWLVSGLPTGLLANSQSDQTDLISGTPTQSGPSTVGVQVTDSLGCKANISLPLLILSGLSITTQSLPGGQVGVNYDSGALNATGGTPFPSVSYSSPYTWSATGLPPGLNISYFTGEIYGLPAVSGPFFPKITVTDFDSHTATRSFVNAIAPPQTHSRYTPTEKAYFALLAEFWLQKSDFWEQAYLDCKQMTSGESPGDPTSANCQMDSLLVVGTSAIGLYYNSKAADPADINYTDIAQPTTPTLTLPSTNSSWTANEIAYYNAWKAVVLTEDHLVSLAQAEITCVNRAEGAYEAGNTYWEQQQVAALTRYSNLETFYLQLLINEIAQLNAAYSQSGFPDFVSSTTQATQFELGISANGIPSDLQQQLTTLGIDSMGLNLVQKAWSSFDPNTVSGNIFQSFVTPAGITTTVQQLVASFITPFSTFSPKVDIFECPLTNTTFYAFSLSASFNLGNASGGIDPATQDVSFSLGSLGITIPAGSFKGDRRGNYELEGNRQGFYEFEGAINGVGMFANVRPTSAGYELHIYGFGANRTTLPDLANPLPVGVQIGGDGAITSVTAVDQTCWAMPQIR